MSKSLVLLLTTQRESMYLDLDLNWHVFGFAAAVGAATCLIFGLIPALRASRSDPGEAMKASGRTMTGSRQRFRLQSALVVSQVAISLVLLVGAGLFVRSFWNLMTLNAGFRERGVVVASLDFSHLGRLPEDHAAQYQGHRKKKSVAAK